MTATDQLCWLDTERLRKLYQNLDRRVARAALNVADVRAVDPSLKGIFFLAPAFGAAQALKVSAESFANIHQRCIARMSTINLQTIRDKRLDCCIDWSVICLVSVTNIGTLMQKIFIPLVAVAALLSTNAEAAAPKRSANAKHAPTTKAYPSFEMRGHRIGDPKPPEEPQRYNSYGAPIYDTSDETIGDVTLNGKISYTYDETGLISLMGLFNSRDADRLRSIFTAKYGAPTKTDFLPMTNGYGGRIQNRVDNWKFKEGTLMLFEQGTSPGSGFFSFENPAARARKEARDRNSAAEAAKGL